MIFFQHNYSLRAKSFIWFLLLLYPCSFAVQVDATQQKPKIPVPQCGHWAILRCCEILGAPITMKEIMKLMPPQKKGHSIYDLMRILEKIGFNTEGRRETFEEFMRAPLPVIVHMVPEHFVVVMNRDDDYVYFFDGNGRRKILPGKEFQKRWTNKTLRVWRNTDDSPLPAFLKRNINSSPCIQFETLLIDKGEIPAVGEGVQYVFPFCNLGKANLIVKKIHTNCGCMESLKPEKSLSPKEQNQIILTYNVNKGTGSFSHDALVETNDPVVPFIKLTASGNTNKAVRMKPDYFNLGQLVAGKTHITTCHIQNTGDMPLDILNIEFPNSQMNVEWRVLSKEIAQQYVPAVQKTVRFIGQNMHTLEISFTPKPSSCGKKNRKQALRIYKH